MEIEVFQDEWKEWKDNKVTKRYFQVLFNKREYLKEMIAEQRHTSETERCLDIGQCIAIKDNINYGLFEFECVDSQQETKENDA
ncbi:MAG: hypothetical protein KGI08_11475 [Thaumarchaeota archaeon]|nr:hypothetical protein [Nitrososphaerota archaeon]